jgi:hypothetical protein
VNNDNQHYMAGYVAADPLKSAWEAGALYGARNGTQARIAFEAGWQESLERWAEL